MTGGSVECLFDMGFMMSELLMEVFVEFCSPCHLRENYVTMYVRFVSGHCKDMYLFTANVTRAMGEWC